MSGADLEQDQTIDGGTVKSRIKQAMFEKLRQAMKS